MASTRPHCVRGNWSEGDWAGQEFDFRETLEYLDDPEDDIDNVLRSTAELYGHRQQSYIAFLESDYWLKVRSQALSNAGNKCQSCGATERLQVHHKRYCQRFTEHENMHLLEVLCDSCHEQSHE
jgi:hypothetical protein